MVRGIRFMAHSGAHSSMFVGRHGSANGAGTNQHTAIDAIRVDGRRKLISYALVVAVVGKARANILNGMPVSGKFGFETFLAFLTDLVRTKSYPHDCSSR
jgi:hypothetical protein